MKDMPLPSMKHINLTVISDCLLSAMDHSGKKKMVHHRQFSTMIFLQKMKEKKQTDSEVLPSPIFFGSPIEETQP